ncbi:MAG: peptidyl-prolyl cis-trans isomerase [Opitutae bacterium]|nr:peptidyl-prolyl cis-trans isomerase [Opitutae bacterium]
MISWIQRYFQKHFRLVFALVLIAVALPMVFIYSASGGAGNKGASRLLDRPFFGSNLGNAEQTRRIFSDGTWSIRLKAGYDALQGDQLQQYALQRVAGLALADELHLPVPTADQVAKSVTTLRAFQNEQGQFDQARYTQFADSLKTRNDLSGADINRILRDDVRLEALARLVGGPGYVLPPDIRQQLTLADSTWTVQVATLGYAAFNPALNPTEDTLKKFHADNAFRYDVPARPRLSLVEFKGADYLPPVAPTEAELRAFYNANAARFPVPPDAEKKDDKPSLAPTAPVDNFPKVRAQVEAAIREAAGARGASKAANDLATAIFDRKLAANSPELAAFLAEQRHPARALAPFAPDNPPAGLPWLASYAEQISRLSQERHFSDPLPTTDSFVILFWNESLPAYKPLFAEVRDRVLADYKDGEKRKLFIARGQALRAQLSAAVKAAPANFATTAAAEKLEVKGYVGFTFRQPPQDMPYPAFGALQGLEAGQVAEMVSDAEKGYLVYAQEKKLPDLTAANPRYAELQQQMMLRIAANNGSTYLGELVERELKKSESATRQP